MVNVKESFLFLKNWWPLLCAESSLRWIAGPWQRWEKIQRWKLSFKNLFRENVWWIYKIVVPYHQIYLWQFGLVNGWQWQWRSVCSSLHFKVCTQDEWKWELVIDMQKEWNSGREENIFFLYTLLPNRIATKKYSDQGGGWAASAQKQLFGETFKLMPLLLCSANQTPPSHTDHKSIWLDGNSELQKAADLAYFSPKLC